MTIEQGVNRSTEYPASFPVNDAQRIDLLFKACFDIIRNKIAQVRWVERMQIQDAIDRKLHRFIGIILLVYICFHGHFIQKAIGH